MTVGEKIDKQAQQRDRYRQRREIDVQTDRQMQKQQTDIVLLVLIDAGTEEARQREDKGQRVTREDEK